jgi:hypothetical protein
MRHHLVTVIAAAIAAMSVSFAIAQAERADPTAAQDRAIVSELRKLNRAIGTHPFARSGLRSELRRYLTDPTSSVQDELEDLRRDIGDTCRALGGSLADCPSGL